MPTVKAFHHIALWTRDFDTTVRFYREGLGLMPIYGFGEAGKRAAIFRCGPDASTPVGHGHVEVFERLEQEDTPPEARLMHFALSTDDVDGMYARALEAGATSRTEPRDVDLDNTVKGIDGGAESPAVSRRFTPRIAFVNGPNGEIIEFFKDPLG